MSTVVEDWTEPPPGTITVCYVRGKCSSSL